MLRPKNANSPILSGIIPYDSKDDGISLQIEHHFIHEVVNIFPDDIFLAEDQEPAGLELLYKCNDRRHKKAKSSRNGCEAFR